MKRQNYFQVHKNIKPKKAKYSDPLSKQQKEGIIECYKLFSEMSNKLREEQQLPIF